MVTDVVRRASARLRRAGGADAVENVVWGGAVAGLALGIVGLELWGRKIGNGPGRYLLNGDVHIMDRGGAAPTVLFESGLGVPLTEWSWVLRGLPDGVAAVTYDRPGTGWSRPPSALRRLAYPESLRAVARGLALRAPFVLVGHSVGGLLIRSFARHYPHLVGGLVFVDSAHPEQYQRSGQQQEALERLRNDLDQRIQRASLGMRANSMWREDISLLPQEYQTPTARLTNQPRVLRAVRRELNASVREWCTEAARLTTVGEKPVAVVTAQRSVDRDPVIAELHAELAGLSTVNRSVVVPESTHYSLLRRREHAEQVVESIGWVIDQIPTADTPADRRAGDPPWR